MISFNNIEISVPYILFYKQVEKSKNTEQIVYKNILKTIKKYLADIFEVINTEYEYNFEEKYNNNEIIWEDTDNGFKLIINFDDFLKKNIIIIKNEGITLNFKWNNNIEELKDKLNIIINEYHYKRNCCPVCLCF